MVEAAKKTNPAEMKEHKDQQLTTMDGRALKSLLKKPGQTKSKGAKNRVVINEKMNEFFAADYIILIKEECCPDYEEECDCCCQEHEMIRLGNCKECRAELNLSFEEGGSDGGDGGEIVDEDEEDDVDDEDEEEEDEVDDDVNDDEEDVDDNDAAVSNEDDRRHNHHRHNHHHNHHHNHDDDQQHHDCQQQQLMMLESKLEERRPVTPARRHQQRETLSPPEGYKDLCIAAQAQQELEDDEDGVCAECDYYQRQAG